jgi:AmmeMemoRadiSam system protein B
MARVRAPAVAGTFYPSSPRDLERTILGYLAETEPGPCAGLPKALIVPHAGYVYSGPIAATAYALLQPFAEKIRRVVLLGPAHRVALRGLALPDAEWFETPLGRVEVDAEMVMRISLFPQVEANAPAHAAEHSLEVQIPFLQKVLPNFTLLPLVAGKVRPVDVAQVVNALWGGDETLFVISTDLSHFLPYPDAQRTDRETVNEILKFDVPIATDRACGATPVNGFLVAAKEHGLKPELLDLRNSGDTAGDRRQVVGYGAFAFCEASNG